MYGNCKYYRRWNRYCNITMDASLVNFAPRGLDVLGDIINKPVAQKISNFISKCIWGCTIRKHYQF